MDVYRIIIVAALSVAFVCNLYALWHITKAEKALNAMIAARIKADERRRNCYVDANR